MTFSAQAELLAILVTIVVHVIGAAVLVWALIDSEDQETESWRDWWPKDGREPEPPVAPVGPRGGIERPDLPDAFPSPVRLREAGRISEGKPAPGRRPAHPPVPAQPVREHERV